MITGLAGSTDTSSGRHRVPFALSFDNDNEVSRVTGNMKSGGTAKEWTVLVPYIRSANGWVFVKGMAGGRIFVGRKFPHYFLRMNRDANPDVILVHLEDLDRPTDVSLAPMLQREAKLSFALPATVLSRAGYQLPLFAIQDRSTLRFTNVSLGLDVIDWYENSAMEFQLYLRTELLGKSRDFPR